MPQLCTKCSRANPPEAVYCHFDGFVLGGHERRGGPISVGSQPFNSPFVFPTGRTCRSFDELALACQAEWSVACGLLKDGYLETFFGGLGRVDLARAAKEAAKFPDVERGLDQLLEKIPSTALKEPKLQVEPVEVSLGKLEGTKERTFELTLDNAGGRLVYGTASSPDSAWISLGEVGTTEKHFQFTSESKLTVHLRPANLRASSKPIEAKILLESNGGTVTVVLKAEKPVKTFPTGPLKGARTPRQVAEMAMKAAKEVGPLFESGEVERWYQDNGWIYPVKTPAASGLAAIQQFFEALGVTKPPKVEINKREFTLEAEPGDMIPLSLEVSAQEKKAVWAHATSNVPWLEVSRPKFDRNKATVAMSIPSVPDRPGETLEGELTVIGNGGVRWLVPVRLKIGGEELPEAAVFDFAEPEPAPPPRPKTNPDLQVAPSRPRSSPEITDEPPRRPPPVQASDRKRRQQGGNPIFHLIPAALLAMAVMVVVVADLVSKPKDKGPPDVENTGGGGSDGWNYDVKNLRDKRARVGVSFTPTNRFGAVVRDAQSSDDPRTWKALTWEPNGSTNSTVVKIGDSDGYRFGDSVDGMTYEPRGSLRVEVPKPRLGWVSKIRYRREQCLVTQHVEVVPGKSALLDTILIYYSIRNDNTIDLPVGIRVLLDTCIGTNDGVPFTIPGDGGFVDNKRVLKTGEIPDFLEVLEDPEGKTATATTARMGLKGIRLPKIDLTEPDEVVICRFPGANMKWDFAQLDMRGDKDQKADSCVAIYWKPKSLEPKKTRHYAFTYGLGELDIGDRLALTVPDRVLPEREFPITCYVFSATKGQTVKLNLPDGLSFSGGDKAEKTVQEVAKGGRALITWKVRASRDGTFTTSATSGIGRSKDTKVTVRALGLFG